MTLFEWWSKVDSFHKNNHSELDNNEIATTRNLWIQEGTVPFTARVYQDMITFMKRQAVTSVVKGLVKDLLKEG